MRPALVVVVDPTFDDTLGCVECSESVLPNAFEYERSYGRLDDAILFRSVGHNELFAQTVFGNKRAIQSDA
jgi:hypothetical protein